MNKTKDLNQTAKFLRNKSKSSVSRGTHAIAATKLGKKNAGIRRNPSKTVSFVHNRGTKLVVSTPVQIDGKISSTNPADSQVSGNSAPVSVRKAVLVAVADIATRYAERECPDDIIKAIAESINESKQLHPICIRKSVPTDGVSEPYLSIYGSNRIRAIKYLQRTHIEAFIEDDVDGDMAHYMRIAENSDRQDLTQLQRAADAVWRAEFRARKAGQRAHPQAGGTQPHDRHVSLGADANDVSRRTMRRYQKIHQLPPEVKQLVEKADLSQAALLKIAEAGAAEAQLAVAKEILDRAGMSVREQVPGATDATHANDDKSGVPTNFTSARRDGPSTRKSNSGVNGFDRLLKSWESSDFLNLFLNSQSHDQKRFVREFLQPFCSVVLQ